MITALETWSATSSEAPRTERSCRPFPSRLLRDPVKVLLVILLSTVCSVFAVAEHAPLERVERSDEELLILSLELGSHSLNDGILAFADEGGVLLPLGQLIESLELPLDVDLKEGRVKGWVVDPRRQFSLDFSTKTVTLNGVRRHLPADALFEAHGDELYVGSELLAGWWPVEIEIDFGRLRAILSSESPLPIARRLERRAKWTRFNPGAADFKSFRERNKGFPTLQEPYHFLDWPAIDGTLDVAWRRSNGGESSRLVRYSTLAQGDFLGMTADLFWSGAHENGSHRISGRRLRLSRTDAASGRFGPLGAHAVSVGDLVSLAHPLITHGRGGRGLGIEKTRVQQGGQFDSTTLRGDVLPGWDVELYRGDQLLDFQTVGADGRYEFRDIPLLVGRNDLRVLMFGPHGEEREAVEGILVGAGALPPGEIRYRVNLVEQGRGLLGTGGDLAGRLDEGALTPGEGEMVFGGTFEYGLSRRWTASTGALSMPVETGGSIQRHSYAWLGLQGSLLGAASLLEVVRDLEGGWAGRIAAQGNLGAVGFRLEHRQFSSFLSELNRGPELVGVTELRLDTHIPLRGRSRIPLSFLSTWEQREGETVFRTRGEFSYLAKLGSIRLANRWGVEVENDHFSVRGRTTLHGHFRRLPVRGNLIYDVWPQASLTNLSLDVRWEREKKFTTTSGADYDLETRVARARAGLEWQSRQQILGVSLEAGSDGSLALQLGTRFSLRRDSTAKRYRLRSDASAKQGVARVHVFLDGNGNGAFDQEDRALENVAFEINGGRHSVSTDEKGQAYLVIGSHRRTDLAVAEGSLEDPYWLSARPGVEVLTRPGRTEFITFPIVATGEIDGTVYLLQDQEKIEVGGVALDLIDREGKVIASAESQYDGFYLFEKILPGKYQLRISPTAADRWGLENLKAVDIEVDFGRVHSGVDFHLELP